MSGAKHGAGRRSVLSRFFGPTLFGFPTDRRSDRVAGLVLAVALILGSVVALVGLAHGGHRVEAVPPTPARPVSSVAPTSIAASSGPGTSTPSRTSAPTTPFHCPSTGTHVNGTTAPARLCVPDLRVTSTLMSLGLNADRTVQVPPLSKVGEAGWYKYSAAPGEVGPTVILGHIDSAQYGDGIFFHLSQLKAGDKIYVSRQDGKTATYQVTKVDEVSKSAFPTQSVYGATSGPAIRLITCGGRFDAATRNYVDNIIVYGTMTDLT